jgi:Spy/CpxP family protein refolding chaperone
MAVSPFVRPFRPLEWSTGSGHEEKKIMTRTIVAALVLVTIFLSCAFAQQKRATSTVSDHDIQLLRKDLRSAQKQIIAANLPLTDAEAQKFWPMYEQYNAEKVKINDDKLLVIKDYAANFESLTDTQAQTLVNKWAQADQSAVQLRTKYIPIFQNVLPGKKAALFFQLDRRIAVLLDLQLASEIPLVEP